MIYHDERQHRARLSVLYPHATIDTPVDIGEETQIWHYAHVMDHCIIGHGCTLGQGVHVAPGVVIGDRCAIQNGAQLFTGVTLEDDVFVGPCAVFTNVVTPRAFVDRKQNFKPTLVKRGASIGANATIVCGVTIGEYALVGAGAVVTSGVPAFTCVAGNPARFHHWVCRCGEKMPGICREDNSYACPHCGAAYVVDGSIDGSYSLAPEQP